MMCQKDKFIFCTISDFYRYQIMIWMPENLIDSACEANIIPEITTNSSRIIVMVTVIFEVYKPREKNWTTIWVHKIYYGYV